jgi:serine/threonine protein kinase
MAVDAARAKSLFLAASDLADQAARAVFLDRECGGDAELRKRVEALLRANDAVPAAAREGGATVDSAPGQPGTEAYGDPTARAGAVLAGKYKLVEEIGEGGMGSVFMAQQTEPVKRAVAVKVIKAGMDSKAVLARFDAERQALAMMDHPNIARVLDAGTTEGGRPFFVMELVKGTPITQFCDERKLTPQQRLELFVPVCQAIQHAHQKGIIHRDIKPSNVLVALYDDRPVPKVIDFGVAKAAGQTLTDKTLMTGFGAVVGTPEYMSPEQASLNNLDIDTRSDVYSLGVLLYELLTGATPVDRKSLGKAAILEILRIVREVEAPRPSAKLSTIDALPNVAANRGMEPAKLSRLLKGELDWLVLKALEKDRARRYETANALARDIERYLADEIVEARPPNPGYRLRKFARRHKSKVIAACLVFLALLCGTVGTSVGMFRAVAAEGKAKFEAEEKGKALEAKERALSAETEARGAEKKSREKAMAALRAMTDEIVSDQMASGMQLLGENKEFLQKIVEHYEGFAAITADDAESRFIRIEGHQRVGGLRFRLGELPEAERALREALALGRHLSADFPARDDFRRQLGAVQYSLAKLLRDSGRQEEAERLYTEALRAQKQLADSHPTNPEYRHELALSQGDLGWTLIVTHRLGQAETVLSEALAIGKQLVADFPSRREFRLALSGYHNALGVVFGRTGRLMDQEKEYLAGIAILEQLVADFPNRPYLRYPLAGRYHNLANALRWSGRRDESATAAKKALALRKELAIQFPNQPELRKVVAETCVNLAIYYMESADFKTAKAYHEEALPHHQAALKALPQNPDIWINFRLNLTVGITVNAGLGDHAGAMLAAEKVRDLGRDPPGNAFHAACGLSYGIVFIQRNQNTTKEERDRLVQTYGDAAMKMLREAVVRGFKDVAALKGERDLNSLRDRADFKALLAELEKMSPMGQK